jgi:glycosyltransferase involved in cell wall biosynthesis
MKKIGFVAFANNSGLGIQSKRLLSVINPDRVLIIDSRGFSSNKELHVDWYRKYQHFVTASGFPTDSEVDAFLQNLTHVFILENPYNFYIVYRAHQLGIKVICQVNYEFCENISQPYLPVPDMFLMPSYWKVEEMKNLFGKSHVKYLPPPIDSREFIGARNANFKHTGKTRFLHIIGTIAYKDRNGTLDLLKAVKLAKSDFELVIRSQHDIPIDYFLDDPRVTYDVDNKGEISEMYNGFDALLFPRRYGGLSLSINEALMSGLPVFVTDISPNKEWLPSDWLVESHYKSQIVVKALIDVFSVDHQKLADKIDQIASEGFNRDIQKKKAFDLAMHKFSEDILRPMYLDLFDDR